MPMARGLRSGRKLVDYSGGRSERLPARAGRHRTPAESSMLKDNPTTLYIYPESGDIMAAIARAVAAGRHPRADLY